MRVEKDFEEFVELLNAHNVEYLIVGAYAVSFHAVPRNTGDIDIFVKPDKENARNLLRVLRDFGFGSLEITEDDVLNPDCVIQLGYEPNRIDLLTSISGVEFDEAYKDRKTGMFGKSRTNFISLEHLIKNKQAASRAKDIADAELLLKQKRKDRKR